jgi:hypothetical protein
MIMVETLAFLSRHIIHEESKRDAVQGSVQGSIRSEEGSNDDREEGSENKEPEKDTDDVLLLLAAHSGGAYHSVNFINKWVTLIDTDTDTDTNTEHGTVHGIPHFTLWSLITIKSDDALIFLSSSSSRYPHLISKAVFLDGGGFFPVWADNSAYIASMFKMGLPQFPLRLMGR